MFKKRLAYVFKFCRLFNNKCTWEDIWIQIKSTKHVLMIIITESWEAWFSTWCIVELLMQYKFLLCNFCNIIYGIFQWKDRILAPKPAKKLRQPTHARWKLGKTSQPVSHKCEERWKGSNKAFMSRTKRVNHHQRQHYKLKHYAGLHRWGGDA